MTDDRWHTTNDKWHYPHISTNNSKIRPLSIFSFILSTSRELHDYEKRELKRIQHDNIVNQLNVTYDNTNIAIKSAQIYYSVFRQILDPSNLDQGYHTYDSWVLKRTNKEPNQQTDVQTNTTKCTVICQCQRNSEILIFLPNLNYLFRKFFSVSCLD